MPLRATPLDLRVEDRLKLEDLVRSNRTSERLKLQCQILLLGSEGHANAVIASRLKLTRSTVLKWRRRFRQGHFQALQETGLEGGAALRRQQRVDRLKSLLQMRPEQGWTIRALAGASGLSAAMVQRTLSREGLTPNPRKGLDARVLAGVRDLVGLHVHAPFHAIVLDVDPTQANGRAPLREAPPETGAAAWLLHLMLRSLEGLHQLEGAGAPSTFAFWRFLSELPRPGSGHQLWCVTDAPLPEVGLRALTQARPDLRFAALESSQAWHQAMRTRIIPTLHACKLEGGCPSLDPSVRSLEQFLQSTTSDPFQWRVA